MSSQRARKPTPVNSGELAMRSPDTRKVDVMNEMDVLGPVDYLVVEFPADKANFSGEVAAELKDLVERDLVRVLDLIVLRKDLDGSIEALELEELEDSLAGELREIE